jgi:cytoskeleton protein RodZ
MSDAGMKGTFIQQDAEQQGEPVQIETTPGMQLAALRNAMGWSVEQVADQLKLAPRQIIAIEQNDFAALPGIAVTRGFIRVYAKLLKTDPAPLLAAIPGEPPAATIPPTARPDLSAPFSEARMPSMYRRSSSSKPLFRIALLIALLLAVVAGVALKWGPALLEPISARIGKQTSPSVEPVISEKKMEAEVAHAAPSSPAVTSAPVPAPTLTEMPPAANAVVAVAPDVGGTATITDAPSGKKNDALVLTLHEDSWIQIKRPDGSTLISRLLKAGASETFDITGPVLLTVGNVAGVEATLRGVPLNIKPKNNSNTARLKLE